MSGAKRRSGYRKTVESATLYGSGEPSASQRLAIVVAAAGSNLLRVRTEDGEAALALLPTRFRKVVWVKRGDALLLSGAATPASAASTAAGVVDGGVRFLVDGVLYPPQLAHLRATGRWPACLDAPVPGAGGSEGGGAGDGGGGGAHDAISAGKWRAKGDAPPLASGVAGAALAASVCARARAARGSVGGGTDSGGESSDEGAGADAPALRSDGGRRDLPPAYDDFDEEEEEDLGEETEVAAVGGGGEAAEGAAADARTT